ncbi:MAG: ATP-binding protein, partial [Deltaproteobacteria bacterium]
MVLGVSLEIAYGQTALKKQREELRASNEELVEQTRALEHASQELKAQQAELEASNAELEIQMNRTRESEARLKVQQKSLAATNVELEGRNEELERQKTEIEKSRTDLTVQAEELAVASKYKSEFLANMSHELRTPLNSLLLLARSLRDNSEGNLTEDQKESAAVIFGSGNDLLNLINEILDLSKIEAGRMDLRMESVDVADIAQMIVRQFDHMARSQGLKLVVKIEDGVPERIVTDPNRLGQVLKNLVGNALKFTEHGTVTLTLARPSSDENLSRSGLTSDRAIAFRVMDTGIGIANDKQRIVFEAFQQADSGDRRKYGGTGLGLSISRELAALLGGEIQLRSEPGVGSTFTVIIPVTGEASETSVVPRAMHSSKNSTSAAPMSVVAAPMSVVAAPPTPRLERPSQPAPSKAVLDDRHAIEDGDRTILIIEDDSRFVAVLIGEVRRRGFKCIAALNGKDGLSLAKSFRPGGIILDINLPDTNGWIVLSALKQAETDRRVAAYAAAQHDR